MTRFITRQHAYEMDKTTFVVRRRRSSFKREADAFTQKRTTAAVTTVSGQHADPNETDRDGITPLIHLVGFDQCQSLT